MVKVLRLLPYLLQLPCMLLRLLCDASCYLLLCPCPAPVLAAENLFLRKQLALYHERNVKPGRATNATRITFVWLGRLVRLATGPRYSPTCDFYPLASTRVSPVLALAIASWTPSTLAGAPSPHSSYGPREPYMGPRAHCP